MMENLRPAWNRTEDKIDELVAQDVPLSEFPALQDHISQIQARRDLLFADLMDITPETPAEAATAVRMALSHAKVEIDPDSPAGQVLNRSLDSLDHMG